MSDDVYTVAVVETDSRKIASICGVRGKVNADFYVSVLKGSGWIVGDTVKESDEL